MLKFQTEQKTFQIGKVKIGGDPRDRAVVLVGSMFYHGHNIVQNDLKGIFDKNEAEELINIQDEFSDKTGNPCMIDLVGTSTEAIISELDFVSELTDAPIFIDSPDMQVRLSGIHYAKEVGLIDRIIYNSITPEIKSTELQEIKDSGIESAVLLTYTTTFTSAARIKAAEKLIYLANSINIKKPLIDTCVLDVPTLGISCKVIYQLKNEIGLPIGAGTHNAIGTWKGLKMKMGKQAIMPCSVSTAIMVASIGADFVLYGPIEDAPYFFPAIAMLDAAYGQIAIEKGKIPNTKHPLFKIA